MSAMTCTLRRKFLDYVSYLRNMTRFKGLILLLKSLKYFGIYPLTSNQYQPELKCDYSDIFHVVTTVIFSVALGVVSLVHLFYHASDFQWIEYDVTGNIFEFVEITLATICYIVILICMLIHSTDNYGLVDELFVLETKILALNDKRPFRDYTRNLYYTFVCFNLLFTITVILSYNLGVEFQFASIFAIIVYVSKGFIVSGILTIYSSVAYVIRIYAEIINESIKAFNFQDINFNFVEFSKLLVLHSQVVDICEKVNDIYGIPILISSAYMFFSMVHELFFIYWLVVYYDPTQMVTMTAMVLNILWILPDIILTVFYFNCSEVSKEVNKTLTIVSRIDQERKICKQIIDNFLIKSIREKISFTAYDFYSVNYSTLFTAICAMLTYVLMLIQFKELNDSKQKRKLINILVAMTD